MLQSAAVDCALAGDGKVREILTPNEAVVKISVAGILIRLAGKRFRRVVSVEILRRAKNRRARVNQQMEVALEVNRAAQISSRWQKNRSATGLIDGHAVEVGPVPHRAEIADVKIIFAGWFGGVEDSEQRGE